MAVARGTAKPKPKLETVAAYLAAQPVETREALEGVLAVIRRASPRATEHISYGMPTYRLGERVLVHVAAFKKHLAIYPGTAWVVRALGTALDGHVFEKATLRFALDEPIDRRVIARIVKARAAELASAPLARSRGKSKARTHGRGD